MKFKVGDEVRVIVDARTLRQKNGIGCEWGEKIVKATGEIICINKNISFGVKFPPDCGGIFFLKENDVELVEKGEAPKDAKGMRVFGTGATRTSIEGKLSYVKALSPIVLRRYVQYLNNHRKQADGSMREFDNWKKGIPQPVYLDGLGRHFLSLWWTLDGFQIQDDSGQADVEDILCAIMFNTMGMLHEILKEKEKEIDRTKPVPGGY